MRRVERDDAGDPVRIAHGRFPDDIAAPVVADDDRLVDLEMVEEADDVAGQTVDGIVLDRRRTVAFAVAALVERDRAKARLVQPLDLATPGEGDLGKAVAEHERHRIVARSRIVKGQPDAVRARELKGRHLHHRDRPRPSSSLGARFMFAQVFFRDLADRGFRQFVADLRRADHLMLAEPVFQERL